MNEEIKVLDDIIKFLNRAQLQGSEAQRLIQCQQYIVARIRHLQAQEQDIQEQ